MNVQVVPIKDMKEWKSRGPDVVRESVFLPQGVREGDHSKVANDSEDTAHEPEKFEGTLRI